MDELTPLIGCLGIIHFSMPSKFRYSMLDTSLSMILAHHFTFVANPEFFFAETISSFEVKIESNLSRTFSSLSVESACKMKSSSYTLWLDRICMKNY